ncbi:MAG: Uma2 family endonuclease [Planctomycetes bacterium]|nr:Uma2 family endonuclease [Planctomycetota bacterium]
MAGTTLDAPEAQESRTHLAIPKLGPEDEPVFLEGMTLTSDAFMQIDFGTPCVELIEGRVYMAPSPSRLHQEASSNLLRIIFKQIEPKCGGKFLHAPFDFLANERNVVQPDIMWLAPDHPEINSREKLSRAPSWALEILSPSSRAHDLRRKREIYAMAGVPHYWIADPQSKALFGLELKDGAYFEVGVSKDGKFKAAPFAEIEIELALVFPWE